jgi:hypothetical protein
MYLKLHNRFSKVCILLATTLILPVLAYADHDDGKRSKDDNDDRWRPRDEQRWGDKQYAYDKDDHSWAQKDTNRDREKDIPVAPEANGGWVLIPFFGAVLLYSWRQFSRAKA